MVTWFYFIVFLLALIMAGSILLRNKNVDTLLVLFSIVVTINCMGRYMLPYGNGYHYLVKTYGPLHILYPLMMLLYAAIMIYYLLYAIRRRKQLSIRIVMTLSITCFSIIIMYILERSLHINDIFRLDIREISYSKKGTAKGIRKDCHGAAPDSWFSHLAIEIPGKDGLNEWLEVVTDEQEGIIIFLI